MNAVGVRRRLLAVWLALAVLVGAVVVSERIDLLGSRPGRDGGDQSGARMLLPVPVDQLGAIELTRGGALHRFERDPAGVWFYHGVHTGSEGTHAHEADPAMAERIASAFVAFGRTRIERQLGLDQDVAEYGLTTPDMLILVYGPNDGQLLAQYAIGDIAPDALSRYVLIAGRSSAVATIPNYQIDNLLELIASVVGEPQQGRAASRSP